MNHDYEKLLNCVKSVRNRTSFVPKVALVLGSGLGNYAESMEVEMILDYHDIDGFPISTVPGHKGRFVMGYVEKVPVIAMQGRVHYYEGYAMENVVLPIRLMKMLGAEILFLTNAAGGICSDFQAGDLMMITDQISSFVPSPLIGENIEELGTRFPDMSEIYSKRLQEVISSCAADFDISLKKGVYLQTTGPNFESPAEIVMYKTLGADAVGMSTACEAIAAKHMGMEICGISCISNLAAGISDRPLCHEEVQESADRAASRFEKLVTSAIGRMKEMKIGGQNGL
ncbi:MAG TPA: purine-nucleoside phosphorylase [Candidatus Anaerostipes excrementavium]|uniref:Purine nucleoside phosphorylase n=1 Tax=Candidatus Anaerostipes excrementavium TaxID=2838463 RepID=A0A9D2B7X6_9FIRM|nr:purine-nucleoside phosphorylase [uncultured Anaerostipes sp.]HIX66580.1 purine-nucleoside phosphorylase [Candidatus Anaerostipes excrementavium]